MNIKIQTTVGRHAVWIEANDLKSAIKEVSVLGEIPSACDKCEKPLVFNYRNPQGEYDYYSLACHHCRREFKLGQTKDTKRLFPKGWYSMAQGNNRHSEEHGDFGDPPE